jgi:DNA-binding transcriptional regulator LsrR (DeoR family)
VPNREWSWRVVHPNPGRLQATDGQIVSTSLADRFISISAQQLAAIPNVIAVAGGRSKGLR